MISKASFRELVQRRLIASVRVVPVPFAQTWCIDAVVRTPLAAGSTTGTVATTEQPQDEQAPGKLRTFSSIDEAARFLRRAGVTTFTVDTDDAVSFAHLGSQAVRVLETTMRVWADDEDERPPAPESPESPESKENARVTAGG